MLRSRSTLLPMEKYFLKDDSENETNFIVSCLVDDILTNICEDKEELAFFDISKVGIDEELSSESELNSSDSSSSSEIGRVYKVTDDFNQDDDTDDQEIFYSSEDLIRKFIELDDQINEAIIIENEEASSDLTKQRILQSDTDDIQVKKHLLKFELSKQLFEEPGTEDEESLNMSGDWKRKMNADLLSKLFDYEQNQVDIISTGESRASATLNKRSLLKVEQDLCAKKSRFSCYEDICFRQNPRSTLVRSSSQPNFESITEEEAISSSDISEESGKLRPIISSSHAPLVGVSSQTDITALASPVRMPKESSKCSSVPSPKTKTIEYKKGFLSRAHSIDFDRNPCVSDMQRSSSNLDKASSKSVTFLFDDIIENNKIR